MQIRRAGPCLTVVKTSTGAAQSVAVAIDKAQWPEVVGTLSGDDTIFIATGSARAQPGSCSRLREMFWSLSAMPERQCLRAPSPSSSPIPAASTPPFSCRGSREHYGRPVITVTVNTGGIDAAAARTLAERARALGAREHHQIDARAEYFEQVLRFLIMGNVRRGQLYPLCVGAERVMQAQTIARMARTLGTRMIAHGCTAAGNDQVRFEVALRTLAPELRCWHRCATRPSNAQDELQVSAGARPAGAAVRRGLFDQPRTVGRDDRRPGNPQLRRQHSR